MIEKRILIETIEYATAILGNCDENIKAIQTEFNVACVYRDNELKINGELEKNVNKAVSCIEAMQNLLKRNIDLDEQTVRYCISLTEEGNDAKTKELTGDFILLTAKGKPLRPKTLGQKKYIETIERVPITFGVGPAGTGKTYLAVAMAVKAFKAKEVSRIVLTRPAVEAGEKLGFLPGDLQNKVDPYLRPLYDGLFDMMGAENYQKLMEKGYIEVAPLAYMRGRTLDDSFIILDEAQNTSKEQMKMFLTRMGVGSRVVVTGDITQIDLPENKKSGLVDAISVLKNIEGIEMVYFTEKDVVRHKLVQDIIKAYDKNDKQSKKPRKPTNRGTHEK
jgi:Phosphate starvation-inducible protein PhoH, predicted ATPase